MESFDSKLITNIQTCMPDVIGFVIWDENWAISRQNGADSLLGLLKNRFFGAPVLCG